LTLDEFMAQLDEEPTSFTLRLAIADWLREHGEDDLAYAFEWAAKWDIQPRCLQWAKMILV
jgi:uncharacterized protein (TIGR02996 family)